MDQSSKKKKDEFQDPYVGKLTEKKFRWENKSGRWEIRHLSKSSRSLSALEVKTLSSDQRVRQMY